MLPIVKIYIHCSYSEWGDYKLIKKWHTDPEPEGNGWQDIGYHYLIYNQFTDFATFKRIVDARANAQGKYSERLYSTQTDGQIVTGRPLSIRGSHVKYDNKGSVGICYIGITPTVAQYNAMLYLCKSLIRKYPLLNAQNVRGHYEYWTDRGKDFTKTCPNFNMEVFRKTLESLN